jgi:hypothetical protein
MSLSALLARLHYLTLTVSCICSIVALQSLFPRLAACLWPLAMLCLLAGRLDERWVLPRWLVNGLALLVAVAAIVWVVVSGDLLQERTVPLIPSLAPALLALLVLRLYRSRARRDRWLLQGMGLLQVALACTLTTEPFFGLLLLLYLSLILPLLALSQIEEARRQAGLAVEGVASPRLGLRPLGWVAAVCLGGLLLFLVTPRTAWHSWDPLAQLGANSLSFSASASIYNQPIDLNRVGDVNLGNEEAFRVYLLQLESAGTLPPDVRWRTGILDRYNRGQWTVVPRRGPIRARTQEGLPRLGPDQISLRFSVSPRSAGGLPLVDPVLFGPDGERYPVHSPDTNEALFVEASGTLFTSFALTESSYQYQQVTRPQLERWPLDLRPGANREAALPNLIRSLTDCPVPELYPWTRAKLERLAAEEQFGLRANIVLPPREPNLAGADQSKTEAIPANAEVIARALTAYLASSGDYTYTLKMEREDRNIDPVLDFLTNVRQGHCERFAGALTLMLRTQGIPARIVRGFRGADASGEGFYIVSQSSAHAWVEALVPAARAGADQSILGGPDLEWIPLDATPGGEAPAPPGFSFQSLGQYLHRWQEMIWRELIVGYGATQQTVLWQNWLHSPGVLWVLLVGVVLSAGLFLGPRLVRWLWRRWAVTGARGPLASLPFLHQLWDLLQRHGLLDFDPTRTPRELARTASAALAARPATAARADLPGRLVELFYRLRFGGQEAGLEVNQAEAEVAELALLLTR